jgi:ABC-type uncharacterized transport system permease subunit
MNEQLINILAGIVATATPLVIAGLGETIIERAGVVNLSLDGSITLSALVGFIAALAAQAATGSDAVALLCGLLAAALTSAVIAFIVALGGITLRQDQVAVGFVLTMLAADIAQFIGQPYTGQLGPQILITPIPILSQIPIIGPILFRQTILVYFSYVLMIGLWYWMFRTRGGLAHRAIGERPAAAFARGTNVNRLRYFYTILGGALVGVAGGAYSLSVKAGWTTPPNMSGDGWIALAIVIFGGWHPFRVALGAYLFAGLRALAFAVQSSPDIGIPVVLLNAMPWILMIVTLLLVSSGSIERLLQILPRSVQKRMRNFLRAEPPAALGTRFDPE